MKKYQDRMEIPELVSCGRYDPTPLPFTWHIREEIHEDGTKTEISRKKIYDTIL